VPNKSEKLLIFQSVNQRTENLHQVGRAMVAEALREGRDVRLRLRGASMIPSLWPDDEIIVRSPGSAKPRRGEIVLFNRNGRLCAHRLLRRREISGVSKVIARGDAVAKCDPPLDEAEILGSVVGVIRSGRRVTWSVSRPSGMRRLIALGMRHSSLLRATALKIHRIINRDGGGI
jgi:hypothetical protein